MIVEVTDLAAVRPLVLNAPAPRARAHRDASNSASSHSAASHSYVFVGGLHRSGTSLVADLLGRMDGAARLVDTGVTEDEGHYLHDAIASAHTYGGPGRFAFAPEAHAVDSGDPVAARQALVKGWERYWSDPDASIRIEKSPQNLIQTRWLDQAMPNSKFVIVTRHPAAVSLATMKWTRPGPAKLRRVMPTRSMEQLMGHWIKAHHLFDQDQQAQGSQPSLMSRVEVVRFEDLFRLDARGEGSERLERLARWVGLAGTVEPPAARVSDYNERWHDWLDSREARRAKQTWLPMAEAAMSRWGYSLDDDLL